MFPSLDATQLWLLSNGLGCLVFAVLTGYLTAALRLQREVSRPLLAASALTAGWFAVLAAAPLVGIHGAGLDIAESARTGAWVITAAWMLPGGGAQAASTRRRRRLAVVAALLLVAIAAGPGLVNWASGGDPLGRSVWYVLAAMLAAIFGLALIEQAYRTSDADARWALKFLCLGVATILAYDFVMYSGALIAHRIPAVAWNARGFVDTLAAPLIAIAAARHDRWVSRISVSHRALLSATAVIAAGLYLLVAAGGSLFIQRLGGSWGEVAALLFATGAVIGLAVLLASGRVRATTRVLLKKHLLAYRYDYREQWLALTHRLGREDDGIDVYERSVRAIASAIDSPAGALWIARDEQFVCLCDWNMVDAAAVEIAASDPLITYLTTTGWVIDTEERADRPDRYAGLAGSGVPGQLSRARLILPLFAGPARLVGVLALASPRSAFTLGWEEIDLLKAAGRQIGVYLDYQENSRALSQARQFETFNRLTAFLMHDLKNIAGQQSLIVQNAHRHKHNPAFVDDMIETVSHSVGRMQAVLDQLRQVSSRDDHARAVAIDAVIDRLLTELEITPPAPRRTGGPSGAVVRVDGERLAMVLRHLIRNAQDATTANGQVTVATALDGDMVTITVGDDGEGMTPAFIRDSLFQPFVSTKAARGMGIGAFQVRDFARAAGGDVRVDSTPGEGTRFSLRLPGVASASGEQGESVAS